VTSSQSNGGRRRGGGGGKAILAATVLGAGALVLPPIASADIVSPPPVDHPSTVFPERDFVSVEGYNANEALSLRLVRNGVTIATASGRADAEGLFEVNHPGGACWDNFTPDVLPQDEVVITKTGQPADVGEAVATGDVHTSAAAVEGSDLVVRGTAFDADGTPMDLAFVEQRVINPTFKNLNDPLAKRDIRAVIDPPTKLGEGQLAADPLAGAGHWIATYTGLSAEQLDAAVGGETRVMSWQNVDDATGERLGITIFEVGDGVVGGPGMPECPAAATYAVGASSHPAVTKAMVDGGQSLVLTGSAVDADTVGVTLTDRLGLSIAGVMSGPTPAHDAATAAPEIQSWTATFSAAALATLADGPLKAAGTYSVAGADVTGATKTIEKDVVAPGTPGATPGSGTYASTQFVTLSTNDGRSVIRFTADGAAASPFSALAPSQLGISSSQTINAIAVDQVGNVSPMATFSYVIAPPAGGGGTTATPPTAASTGGGSTQQVSAPVTRPAPAQQVLPATVRPLRITGLLAPRRAKLAAARKGVRLTMVLPQGTRRLRYAVKRGARTVQSKTVARRGGLFVLKLKLRSTGTYRITLTPQGARPGVSRSLTVTVR